MSDTTKDRGGLATAGLQDLPQLKDLSDEGLVSAYLEGRVGAFQELHQRYERRLSSFIRRRTGASDQVDDILQDVWIRVVRHLHRFDADRKFSTWVFTIAANLCKNVLRNRSRSRLVPFRKLEARREPDSEPLQFEDTRMAPDRLYEKRATKRLVEDTLTLLPHHHQEVFRLRELRGKSYRDVATTLGVRLGTVKSRLHRARTEFADLLELALGGPPLP